MRSRRHERRLEGWRQRGLVRRTAEVLSGKALAQRNLRMGLTLAAVCAFMFTAAIVSGVLAHIARAIDVK